MARVVVTMIRIPFVLLCCFYLCMIILVINFKALIGFRDGNTIKWECGGTLISDYFVLSAAHCFETRNGPARYVRLGDHDISQTGEASHIDIRIIESIPHPNYKFPSHYNDIGLFKLQRRVQFNSAIRPACLPELSYIKEKTALASGWGTVEWHGKDSKLLLKVALDIFSQKECRRTFRTDAIKLNRGVLEESQLCAGSHKEEKDTCQGDSGGPLQVYHSTHSCMYTIVGVTSFGIGCGTVGVPGVYTRVISYLSWIERIVWPNQ